MMILNYTNKFYNVTYLEVNPKYKMIEGIPVYEAKVSWYKVV